MNVDQAAKEKARQTFTVPNTSGNYATEVITFGRPGSAGSGDQSFQAVTAVLEDVGRDGTNQAPSGMVAELWLSQIPDGTYSPYNMPEDRFWFSGQVLVPANVAYTGVGVTVSYGAATWALAGWPLAEIRVKSAGNGGSATISAAAL